MPCRRAVAIMNLQGMIIRLLLQIVSFSMRFCVGDVLLLPSTVDIWEHSDVTLHCTNQGLYLKAVRWKRNGQTAAMQFKQNNCQVNGFLNDHTFYSFSCIDNSNFSVTLKNISSRRHTEEWQCLDHYLKESNSVTIFVKVPAKTAFVLPRQNVFSAVENAIFSPLQCISNECRPEPTFLWYMDQNTDFIEDDILLLEDISNLNSTNKIQTYTSTLHLTTNRSMNGWFVFCAVQNSIEDSRISDKILLNITDFPQVRLMKIKVTEGDNFTYLCNVNKLNASLDVTNVTWSWEDKVWYGQQLTLNNVSRTQAGLYLCGVKNITNKPDGFSVDSSEMGNIQLNVEYKAQVLNLLANSYNANDNPTVCENDAVNISCNIEGNPLPEGELTFLEAIYLRNANIVTKIKTSSKDNSTNLQLVTHLDAKCTDAGQYTCIGWNTLNSGMRTESNDSLKLFVKCTPRISPFHEIHDHVFCALSSDVTFSFTALAYPVPPVSGFVWYKKDIGDNWEIINSSALNDNRTTISTSGLQSDLTITNITQLDYGFYKLMIENEVGKYEHTFKLSAKSQPVDPDDDKKIVILAGATGGTVGSVLVLLTIFLAVVVIRRRNRHIQKKQPPNTVKKKRGGESMVNSFVFSSKRSKAAASIELRDVDGSQAADNFSQVVNTNSSLNGGYPIFYEELRNAAVANYASLEGGKPHIYEELPNEDGGNQVFYEELLDAEQKQQNAYENIK